MDLVLAVRYLLSDEVELGTFPVLGYKIEDKINTRLLMGTNPNISVSLASYNEDIELSINHVFVGRFIDQVLKIPQNEVEIGNLHTIKGQYIDRPDESIGELLSHFIDEERKDTWVSYDHVSGPYIVDKDYILRKLLRHELADMTIESPIDLIPDRRKYMMNPQDLPLLGVTISSKEEDTSFKSVYDIMLKSKPAKRDWLN